MQALVTTEHGAQSPCMLRTNPQDHTSAATFFNRANFLVAKITDYCNLRCRYCHQDALFGKPKLMSLETFRNAVRLILKPSISPLVYVQFHGGEPLLWTDEFYRQAISIAKEELEHANRRVRFYMQTNLTLLTEEREALLTGLGIGIGFSLDGPPAINDKMREKGERVVEVLRRMRKNGTLGGTICLINPSNWDHMPEVLNFFHDEQILSVRFNAMVCDGRAKNLGESPAAKLFEAKKTILDYMLGTHGKSVIDVALQGMMSKFVSAHSAPSSMRQYGCESLYCQGGRHLFSVNPDGDFFPCDRIAELSHWAIGNVNEPFDGSSLAKAQTKRNAFHGKDEWWSRCEQCDAKKICDYSCTAYYIDKVDNREAECEYTRRMWSYFLERKNDIFDFMKHNTRPVFIDDKKPLYEQNEETWFIRDLANTAFYDELTTTRTLATNHYYRLFERSGQYYLYTYGKRKIFEVDSLVAEVAEFNAQLLPDQVFECLRIKWEPEKLYTTLANLKSRIPEMFKGATQSQSRVAL